MGKGSTKNERKLNRRRAEKGATDYETAKQELARLRSLPVRERDRSYDELLRLVRGRMKRAAEQQKRSENDTQTGKRGRR